MPESAKRLGWILVSAVGLIASLLTFPSTIPWMIAGWLLVSSILILRGKPGWLPLFVCLTIILIKNIDWPPVIYFLASLMLLAGVWRVYHFRKKPEEPFRPRVNRLGVIALWGAWLAFTWMWSAASHRSVSPELDGERPVVCLGDSLTAFGYPAELGRLLAIPVINMGTDGITTSDALRDLPKVIEANPQIVVIELGGHDYLKGKTRAATKENLQTIIDACHEIGAEVILMEIPRGFIFDPFGGLERELASENDLELVSDGVIRNLVLWSPFAPPGIWLKPKWHLSKDGLHPNKRGNQYMADSITRVLIQRYVNESRITR
ncbi:MAG: GDSL-type esterase/lipase family protein [Planctomycetaceae bacterium]